MTSEAPQTYRWSRDGFLRAYEAGAFDGRVEPTYWALSSDVIYEHTQPTSAGYRVRTEYRRGEQIPLGYADTELSVDELLGTSADD